MTAETRAKIEALFPSYPAKRGALLPAIYLVQEEQGYVGPEQARELAELFELEPVQVWEVLTFYNMFYTEPQGRHHVYFCTNLPCSLQGAGVAAQHLKRTLKIGFNETTPDGRFTLKEGECFGACGDAPVVLVNNKRMCCAMTPERLDALLKELE